MTKISNEAIYTDENPISELDFVVGTDGNNIAKKTKSFRFGAIRAFCNAGLEPILGGTLAITQYDYTGPLNTPQDVVNQLLPNKVILSYEVFIVSVNGTKYITTIQNRVVGDGQLPTTAIDYILLSISTSDATTTVKGMLKLAGDLGGTADLPTTPTAVHKTGTENVRGLKIFQNPTSIDPSGISMSFSATGEGNGKSLTTLNTSPNNTGIVFENRGTTDSSAFLVELALGQSNAEGISINTTGNVTPNHYPIRVFLNNNRSNTTFSVRNTGDTTANKFIKIGGLTTEFLKANGDVDSNVYAIDANVVHTTGAENITGFKTILGTVGTPGALQISSTGNIPNIVLSVDGTGAAGISMTINSTVSKGILINTATAATGDIITSRNNGVDTFNLNKLGAITASGNFLSTGTNNQIMVSNSGGNGVRMGACSTVDAFLGGSTVGDGVLLAHQKLFLAVGAGEIPIAYTETGNLGIGVINPTTKVDIAPSTATAASLRFRQGVAPTSPNDGDMWLESNTLTGLKIRIAGVTRTVSLT